MPYISFYKDRLPFKPRKNVVIYFDVTGIGIKRYYWTFHDYYYHIVEEFRRNGLEFCLLPKTAQDMDLDKICNDSNPQASPDNHILDVGLYQDSDLLEYMADDYDPQRLYPSLIQYAGDEFYFTQERNYTFSYIELPPHFDGSPISLIDLYMIERGRLVRP